MGEVVFDIETYGNIKDLSKLEVTVVSIYEYETDKYTSFEEAQLAELWPRLEKAERLIGFNSEHFDLPILNRYYAGDLLGFPHLDILKEIKQATGHRYKLNDIAKASLQIEKSADGLAAQKWWESGEVDKIKKYCEQDVRVTKGIYEYGKKNKMLYYETLTGQLMPFPINFDPPSVEKNSPEGQPENINLTLPL